MPLLAKSRLARLQDLTAALAGCRDERDIAGLVVGEGHDALGASASVLYALDPEGGASAAATTAAPAGPFVLLAERGLPPGRAQEMHVLPLDAPLPLATALQTMEPIWLEDRETLLRAYPNLGRSRMDPDLLQAAVALPLVADGRVTGGLGLSFAAPRPFDDVTRDFLLLLARHCALALDRARLHRDAQRALRARDEFLALAAHELRTPLSAARLRAAQLLRDPAPERLVERLSALDGALDRLVGLSERLLDLSALDAGRLDLRPEDLDLVSLARALVAAEDEALRGAGCTLTLAAAAPVLGRWDRLRVEQILRNLLANATRYGRGGAIEVSVDADGDLARLVVRDQGPGIAPEDQGRIFGKFERASSHRHYGGLGLGLWISRRLAEAMGGTLCVESRPGEGAAFVLTLPLRPA